LATAVDVATGAAVAANNDDAVGTVIPPSSTKDEEAYVGALVAAHLRMVPVKPLQYPRCCNRAAAVALCTTAMFHAAVVALYTAAPLRAATTAANAAAAVKLPPTSHWRAATTAADAATAAAQLPSCC
jgi:hypothetical protein